MKKRLIALVLGLSICLSTTSCFRFGSTTGNGASSSEVQSGGESEKEPAASYSMGEKVVLKDWEISVTEARIVESISLGFGSYSPDQSGDKYLQVFVTVTNNGKKADYFMPLIVTRNDINAKLCYGDGYEFSSTVLPGYENDMHSDVINPLSSRTGEIVFQIPESVASDSGELLIEFRCAGDSVRFKLR